MTMHTSDYIRSRKTQIPGPIVAAREVENRNIAVNAVYIQLDIKLKEQSVILTTSFYGMSQKI